MTDARRPAAPAYACETLYTPQTVPGRQASIGAKRINTTHGKESFVLPHFIACPNCANGYFALRVIFSFEKTDVNIPGQTFSLPHCRA